MKKQLILSGLALLSLGVSSAHAFSWHCHKEEAGYKDARGRYQMMVGNPNYTDQIRAQQVQEINMLYQDVSLCQSSRAVRAQAFNAIQIPSPSYQPPSPRNFNCNSFGNSTSCMGY